MWFGLLGIGKASAAIAIGFQDAGLHHRKPRVVTAKIVVTAANWQNYAFGKGNLFLKASLFIRL
jgi:hypothetical protein